MYNNKKKKKIIKLVLKFRKWSYLYILLIGIEADMINCNLSPFSLFSLANP